MNPSTKLIIIYENSTIFWGGARRSFIRVIFFSFKRDFMLWVTRNFAHAHTKLYVPGSRRVKNNTMLHCCLLVIILFSKTHECDKEGYASDATDSLLSRFYLESFKSAFSHGSTFRGCRGDKAKWWYAAAIKHRVRSSTRSLWYCYIRVMEVVSNVVEPGLVTAVHACGVSYKLS